MPKTFSEVDRKKWLEFFESGRTAKWIARDARCDFRTVKRGIDEARRRRESTVARTELYKDALRKHHDDLLQELEKIFSSVMVPEQDFAPLSWHEGQDSVFSALQGADLGHSGGTPKSGKGELTLRLLLKEHLRNDSSWKVIDQWEKANAAHLRARIALQLKTKATLEKKTSYNWKAVGNDAPMPFVVPYTTGPVFFKAVLVHTFGGTQSSGLEKEIVVNQPDNGAVSYHSSVLAMAPGNEEQTRKNLLAALAELKASPEAASVFETYRALVEATSKAHRSIREIMLLGMIPGQCQICRRLGV